MSEEYRNGGDADNMSLAKKSIIEMSAMLRMSRSTILAVLVLTVSVTFSTAVSGELKKLEAVPLKYQTNINIVPVPKGGKGVVPKVSNSISIGKIGPNFVQLHNRKLKITSVMFEEDNDRIMLVISTEPTGHGGWDFSMIIGKVDGKFKKWGYVNVNYSRRMIEGKDEPDGKTYVFAFDK